MAGNYRHRIAASLVTLGLLSTPTISVAQSYRYAGDDRPSVVVRCAAGQRAVMASRRGQVVGRCVGSRGYARSQYYARVPRRTKTKSALLIAGSAASGAGVGAALKGKKGALIGAAIGGGVASIYDASKRR